MKSLWKGLWLLFLLIPRLGAGAEVLDAFLARVDNTVITLSQIYDEIQIRRIEGASGDLKIADVCDDLIKENLYAAEAVKMGLEPDPANVSEFLNKSLPENASEEFKEKLREAHLTRADFTKRAARLALVAGYLKLRKDMTFISQAEIREFLIERPNFTQRYSWEEARDHARQTLTRNKFKEELIKWSEQQTAKGRVQLIELPDEL